MRCAVSFEDGSSVGTFTFIAVPRVGEWIVLLASGPDEPRKHRVKEVVHSPDPQIAPVSILLVLENDGASAAS